MLPYALAIAIGASSLVLFLTAFLMPKIHRQDDFLWSGVGLLYALVLWFCATSIRGAVLLGQLAAVTLLSFYAWEVYTLRKAIADPESSNIEDRFSVVGFISKFLERSVQSIPPETAVSDETQTSEEAVSDTEEKISKTDDISQEEATLEITSETEEDSVTPIETTSDEAETETIEITSETEEDSVTPIETTSDEAQAETIEITSETEEDSVTPIETTPDETETVEISSETEEDSVTPIETTPDEAQAETETVEISSETEADSVATIEKKLEAQAETIEISSETEADSVATIEKKLEAIFQDEATTEVETEPSTSNTSDIESSNWGDDLNNWNEETKLQTSSEEIKTSFSDSKNKTHSDPE